MRKKTVLRPQGAQRMFLPGQTAKVGAKRWKVGAVILTGGEIGQEYLSENYLMLIDKHGVVFLCPERDAT